MSQNVTINTNASLFIIPNSACKLEGFFEFAREDRKADLSKLLEANGKSFDEETEYFVETWMHSTDLDCDNMCDHGFRLSIDGKEYWTELPNRDFPKSLLDGHKEGEHIQVIYPLTAYPWRSEDDEEIDVNLNIDLELNQRDYRYRRFGNFEDVLKKVCR